LNDLVEFYERAQKYQYYASINIQVAHKTITQISKEIDENIRI